MAASSLIAARSSLIFIAMSFFILFYYSSQFKKLFFILFSLILSLTITFLVFLMTYDGNFSLIEGFFCLGIMVIYIWKLISENNELNATDEEPSNTFQKKYYLYLLVSPIFIFIGAKYTVDSVVEISSILSIGKEIIALSAVAFGTSLPEILVTIAAAKKGQPEIAIGNVIGSNIFNMLAVLGIPRLFGEFPITESIISSTLYIHMAATFIFIIIIIDKKINKFEGYLLLSFYVYFLMTTFGWLK